MINDHIQCLLFTNILLASLHHLHSRRSHWQGLGTSLESVFSLNVSINQCNLPCLFFQISINIIWFFAITSINIHVEGFTFTLSAIPICFDNIRQPMDSFHLPFLLELITPLTPLGHSTLHCVLICIALTLRLLKCILPLLEYWLIYGSSSTLNTAYKSVLYSLFYKREDYTSCS